MQKHDVKPASHRTPRKHGKNIFTHLDNRGGEKKNLETPGKAKPIGLFTAFLVPELFKLEAQKGRT